MKLGSNVNYSGNRFSGIAKTITHTEVSSCITVTCHLGDLLAGIHIAPFSNLKAGDDLDKFGLEVRKNYRVSAMYVVGFFDAWTTGTNKTGLRHGDGTLVTKLKSAFGFTGLPYTLNLSDDWQDATVTVKGKWVASDANPVLSVNDQRCNLGDFTPTASAIAVNNKSGRGCVIL